ncbi:MAG: ATP-binding cassette domain-containing protein [Chlamydiales bacterium]
MTETLIEIEHLKKSFGPKLPLVLEDIQAKIVKGEIVGLVGHDGAGKTTLIRLIASLLVPTEGHIAIVGKDSVKESEFVHTHCGYMPQKFGLYEDLTVMQNLNLYADLRGITLEKQTTFDQLLKFTNLSAFTTRLAKNLSGGMKQKLGLACALIKKPLLLLLDEPTVGVDPISRRELWKMVTSLLEEKISVLWSTAYLDEAERCDSVLLLNEGKMLFYGKPKELVEKMTGRVFAITTSPEKRRDLLSEFLEKDEVVDGTLQGKDLRIVTKAKVLWKEGTPIPPRFEDAFIDILGGTPKGKSKLAQAYPPKKMGSDYAVLAENLTKKFGSFIAVDRISLKVKRGTIFGLLGPNGAGKTTTFRMMCGLIRPSSGKAIVAGLDQQAAPSAARAKMGYMAQKFSLYGHLSVLQNLKFFSGIYNLSNAEQKVAIENMVDVFYLKPYLNTSADLLPFGLKRRLALACSTMHAPEVLFLDEPTSGVDPLMRREFWNHINGLVEHGVTVMVTTHFMDEADYCDQIALMYNGKIIHMDTPDAMKDSVRSPQNPNPTLEDAFITLIEKHE